MEYGKASNDTYVLKVNNLHCCNACPKKIRRKLSKIPGIVSIDMDIEAGLVKISGRNNLDPSIFVKTIAKAGKKAQFPAMAPAPIGSNAQFPAMGNMAPAPIGSNAQFPAMGNMAPAPIGSNAQFPAMGNMAPAPMSMPAPATTIDTVSNHHNNPSINSDNHYYKIDRTQHGNSNSGHFPDHHGWSDKVHINEAASVNPPVALPLRNQLFMRPQSQYGGFGFRGSHGCWPRMSEPPPPPPPPPPMPPVQRYYRWSEPLPYYLQEQPPPVGNAPGHYLFNDENTEGCMIV